MRDDTSTDWTTVLRRNAERRGDLEREFVLEQRRSQSLDLFVGCVVVVLGVLAAWAFLVLLGMLANEVAS